MKKILSLVLVFACLLGSMAVLSACGEPEDDGAEINVYLGEPVFDFDPTDYYTSPNAEQLMSLIFEPLFALDEDGDLKKAAADKYEVDEEKRTITIELRETYWSDGVRVKGEDYVYAWREVLLNPNNPNPAAALLFDIENAVEVKNGTVSSALLGITAKLYELTITYREGADYERLLKNLAAIATSPLRQDTVTLASTYWSKNTSTIVTNGPFSVTSLDYGIGSFEVSRNVGYHQSPSLKDYDNEVNPGKIASTFSVAGSDVAFTYADLENKTVFFIGDASLEERAAKADEAEYADDLSTYTYVFNTEKAPFNNKDVRRALSLAVDRDAIIEAITFGKAATGFLPEIVGESIYTKKVKQELIGTSAKLDEAKALMSGVTLSAQDKNITLTVNDDAESIAIANIVKANWAELGFNVTVKAIDTKTVTVMDAATNEKLEITDSALQVALKEAGYGVRDFDVLAIDWQLYSRDAFVGLAAFTTTMNGNGADLKSHTAVLRKNISGWTNEQYDAYVSAAFTATDDDVRAENLRLAEALLIEESPIVPLVYNQTFAFVSKDLSKVELNGLGNFVFTDTKQKNYKDYISED